MIKRFFAWLKAQIIQPAPEWVERMDFDDMRGAGEHDAEKWI